MQYAIFATVLSVSRSFAGALIISKYPVVVFSVWMVLCFLLKLVQVHFGVSFSLVMTNARSLAFAFFAVLQMSLEPLKPICLKVVGETRHTRGYVGMKNIVHGVWYI